MSAWHDRQYQLAREREIRAAAHRARVVAVEENNESFLHRYEDILNDLVADGLEEFMASEFAYVRSEIHRIRYASDAFAARNWSVQLGQRMRTLPRQAREQKWIAEEHERLQREEAAHKAERQAAKLQAEKETAWTTATSNWENKLARNLAFKALAELRQRVLIENLSVAQMQQAIAQIKQQAEVQARKTQQEFNQTVQAEAVQTEKAELVKSVESANLPLTQTELMKQKIAAASWENLAEITQETNVVQDDAVENEAVRKEMVKAVYQSLKQAGFTVLPPVKQTNSENDIVLIQASRPSGNQARFRIKLDGSVRYEFDNYKGQHCKKDMDQVLPKLSEIYGVNLSKERVIWENPDDEKMDAKPISPIHTTRAR
ncbi:hypothetical protein [Thiothrix subterranea]|uniref:Uncharacterized protein n=1 Tax=Thiothrix subterranea TaxID=2735563 RepID=A0AA51R163_9GAMM|nr:hypothetical protein [Thiothrix subterranea]WML88732.1 hypothetical protein RCG00_10200 [Thiothrix subterranea]